ncbi:MAG: BBP7 family outer membrane beta-barrel protein [Pirellulaceae bacterium]
MLAFVVGLCSHADAQLRSGRVQRHLRPSAAESTGSAPDREPEIALASHSVPSDKYSILEDDSLHSQVAPASYLGSGDCGCSTSGMACDSLGCDACCGMSEIAPTCMTACPPGCGPLMALWYRLSVRAETPLYWRARQLRQQLVTSSAVGTPQQDVGVLDLNSTNVLLGDSRLNEDLQVGVRLSLSTWLGGGEQLGLMFRYWNAGEQNDTFAFNSNQFPNLARPIFDTTNANAFQDTAQLIGFQSDINTAPTLTGNISVDTQSSVDGLEVTLKRLLYKDRFTRIDWLYGYQHVSIDEGLQISSFSDDASGVTIAVSDRFNTRNDFNGVSYGITSTRTFARWKMETLIRLGAGNLRRRVNISGNTTITSGGLTNPTSQGLLARDTNSHPFEDDTFIVLPEVGINFGYCLRRGMDFTVGYNYMHIPKVAQASQQINDDLAVNLSDPLTGPSNPSFQFDERTYWLHSLGLGLQWRY